MVLFLSTVPFHLLFNSTIFATHHAESDFNLAIGTEDFVCNNGRYQLPGASIAYGRIINPGHGISLPVEGYGLTMNEPDSLSDIATIAKTSHLWDRLDVDQCREEYNIKCHGLGLHRNVVLVIDQSDARPEDSMSVTLYIILLSPEVSLWNMDPRGPVIS